MTDHSHTIGEQIKSLRLKKGLSLEDLAAQAGFSTKELEKIEDQDISPPLGYIISLAKVLNVPVGEFFGDCGDSPFCIVRKDSRTAVSRFSTSYSYEGLGLQKKNRQMEPFLVTLQPKEAQKVETNQHIGEEFIFVLEGSVEISLLNHRDILNPGDSIYYDSNVPHILRCHGDKPATILAVIYAKEEMIIL